MLTFPQAISFRALLLGTGGFRQHSFIVYSRNNRSCLSSYCVKSHSSVVLYMCHCPSECCLLNVTDVSMLLRPFPLQQAVNTSASSRALNRAVLCDGGYHTQSCNGLRLHLPVLPLMATLRLGRLCYRDLSSATYHISATSLATSTSMPRHGFLKRECTKGQPQSAL